MLPQASSTEVMLAPSHIQKRRPGVKLGEKRGNYATVKARQRVRERILRETEVTTGRVLCELALQGFGSIKTLFDDAGNLKSMKDLTLEEAAIIQQYEVTTETGKFGPITRVRIRLWDKIKALELLAQNLGLLKQAQDATGPIVVQLGIGIQAVGPSPWQKAIEAPTVTIAGESPIVEAQPVEKPKKNRKVR